MQNKKLLYSALILVLVLILYGVFSLLGERAGVPASDDDFILPSGEVSESGGVKHTVPLNSILSGGPPKDGIPSIDNPAFVTVSEANDYLDDGGIGISVSFNGVDRFYPNQILVWHEIVNDEVGGQPVLVTYCPLCGTGIVYEPIVKGEVTEFGTSGKLWNSNLVMYDRQTNSYWSQVLGESIVGEMAGTPLELLPHDNLLYEEWKQVHPNGEVLSRETGFIRNYNRDPYGGYYSNKSVYFPVDFSSEEFHPKEITFGIKIDDVFGAYTQSELLKSPDEFDDQLAGTALRISYDKHVGTIDIREADTGEEIVPTYGFWFSWFSVHPETEIYRAQ